MNVVFVSNFLNHHQLPFCQAVLEKTKGNFIFVAISPTPKERLNMGYYDMNMQYPFVLRAYESDEQKEKALQLAEECDVLLIGGFYSGTANEYVKKRIKQKKLTFQYLERIYKSGVWHILSPKGTSNMLRFHTKYFRKPMYALCASAYTAWDLSLTGSYINKTFKWGYFPQVKQYDIDDLMSLKRANKRVSILWVARLIPLKHPEVAVALAAQLKKDGYEFDLDIIGNGILEETLRSLIDEKGLSDCVHLLGSMSPELVRDHMDRANIFLFTSDYNEGWGAVLNESMNSACAVVASHAIGSVPFLIDHGKNGFIYENGNHRALYSIVKRIMDTPESAEQIGREAYKTMVTEWAPEMAAERFLSLSEQLMKNGNRRLYNSGPCSIATRISNSKMKRYLSKKN